MTRARKTITFSLPSDMADRVEKVSREEGRSTNDLVQDALSRYLEEREWQDVLSYGERKAAEQRINEGDVERLVDEYRSEAT